MQDNRISLIQPLCHRTKPLKSAKDLKQKLSDRPSIDNEFVGTCKTKFLQNTFQNRTELPNKEQIKAENYLSTIIDPLWKHVCRDLINMMGHISFLKIWNSTLGEIFSQDQGLEIHCQTQETAHFIQQYDFVILGSLQTYFPALKQLRVKTISSFSPTDFNDFSTFPLQSSRRLKLRQPLLSGALL